MVLPLLCLIGGTLTAWLGVASCFDSVATVASSLAVAITLPPAAATFLAVVRGCRMWPGAGPTIVMAGTFFRMMAAVAGVAILNDRAAEFGTTPTALARWTTGFYLLTLTIETGFLYSIISRPTETEGARDEPPTG